MALGFIQMPGIQQTAGTEEKPLVSQDNSAGVDVTVYDIESDPINGKVPATIIVGGKVNADDADGVVSYDLDQGFKAGQTITISAYNNSDTGYYRNDVQVTLKAGTNTVNVPVKKVGTIVPKLGSSKATSASITVGNNGLESEDIILIASQKEQYFSQPVVACKDTASEGTPIGLGNVTDIYMSGFDSVDCDKDVLSGYQFCMQSQKDYITTDDYYSGLISVDAGNDKDPVGNVTCVIQDGVPYEDAGTLNINDADAYDSTGTAFYLYVL
jgi:hypothetical protein